MRQAKRSLNYEHLSSPHILKPCMSWEKKTKKIQLHWRFTPNKSDSLLHTRGNLVPKFSFPSAQKDHS